MSWRACRAEEHGDVVPLVLALYREDPGSAPVTPEMAYATLRRLAAEPVRGVAVVHEGQAGIDAYALLCSFWSNELGGEVCIVDELFVLPAARQAGIASGLLTALARSELSWFRQAVALELEVTPGNARARALYERLGFVPYKNAVMRRRR